MGGFRYQERHPRRCAAVPSLMDETLAPAVDCRRLACIPKPDFLYLCAGDPFHRINRHVLEW